MNLEKIGFYTLSDKRARAANHKTRLWRCELVLGARCNFHCPYCRGTGGPDIPYPQAEDVVIRWAKDGLKNIRFSGGEPTLYPGIFKLCALSRELGISRIAISTNGSATKETYQKLIDCGANDFSVSLDACCAEDGDKMAGGIKGAFLSVVESIKWLSARAYTTVGIVLTEDTMPKINEIVRFADSLSVSDVRIIPAAQTGDYFSSVKLGNRILKKYPILNYRVKNIIAGRSVRGIRETDYHKCGLLLDDMAISQGKHYPCIIYFRESGQPIGNVGDNIRAERKAWFDNHDTFADPICRANCLDVCVDYNNRFRQLNRLGD